MAESNEQLQMNVIKEQLIETEKMAVLGRLFSGIIHEINSPLSVVRAASSNIDDALDNLLNTLFVILQDCNAQQISLMVELIKIANQSEKTEITSREERSFKKKLTSSMEQNHIENADNYADMLVDIGIHTDVTLLLSQMGAQASQLITFAFNFCTLKRNNQNIHYAIEKTTKIISSIKNYTYNDSKNEMTQSDVASSIDAILSLYAHLLKKGINIQKNFQPVPPIACNPDELNQVWTNLIQNAIQAMNYKGTLTLNVYQENSSIVVEITDGGCGIPQDVQNRIFEPFFTTKPRGEGSGLGLEITKRIIDKHAGSINFTSAPGQTTFTVKLPISPKMP